MVNNRDNTDLCGPSTEAFKCAIATLETYKFNSSTRPSYLTLGSMVRGPWSPDHLVTHWIRSPDWTGTGQYYQHVFTNWHNQGGVKGRGGGEGVNTVCVRACFVLLATIDESHGGWIHRSCIEVRRNGCLQFVSLGRISSGAGGVSVDVASSAVLMNITVRPYCISHGLHVPYCGPMKLLMWVSLAMCWANGRVSGLGWQTITFPD